ncbi:transposase family protein (plasmid) [Streptomyces sp. CA-294286]|uniref:transposase family protein n=1 Tax=Streptomyces sp. CA-294286 TaxID=3240070 RepID=UPI003D92CE19
MWGHGDGLASCRACEGQEGPRGHGSSCLLRTVAPASGRVGRRLAPRWVARGESGRHRRRKGDRRREAGVGPKYELVLTDWLLVTLVHLRTGLTHEALGVHYEVGSSTTGRAIREVRPMPADRGFAVPDRPGIRLRTLEDVSAHDAAEDVTLRIDGMETQVRRLHAGCPGRRRAFVSGKRRQNTVKTTTISDGQGRTLWPGAQRPGRMHDRSAVRTEGIAEQFPVRRQPRRDPPVLPGQRRRTRHPAGTRGRPHGDHHEPGTGLAALPPGPRPRRPAALIATPPALRARPPFRAGPAAPALSRAGPAAPALSRAGPAAPAASG